MAIHPWSLVFAGLIGIAGVAGRCVADPGEPASADRAQAFLENCSACHLATGRGVPPIFPALAGNVLVKGDPAAVVQVVLAGRNGMPAFRNDLDDAQLADIISYVRSSWGNGKSPVTADFILKVRVLTRNERSTNPVKSN